MCSCHVQVVRALTTQSSAGHVLAHSNCAPHPPTLLSLIQRQAIYAEWCRVSARALAVNPPTVVQSLFTTTFPGALYSFAASVSAGKGEGSAAVRHERVKALREVWPHSLPVPTPVQRMHAYSAGVEPSAELFGTPWGHCGETVTFAS